jgi:hypothetical protein
LHVDHDPIGHYLGNMQDTHTVTTILEQWPSRQAVLEDARAARPDLDLFAVHRWHQRGSIPSRYWAALIAGAKRRGVKIGINDLAEAHAAIARGAA